MAALHWFKEWPWCGFMFLLAQWKCLFNIKLKNCSSSFYQKRNPCTFEGERNDTDSFSFEKRSSAPVVMHSSSENKNYRGVRGLVCYSLLVPLWLLISRPQYDSPLGGVSGHNCRKRGWTPVIHFFISTIIKLAIHLESTGVSFCECVFVCLCVCVPACVCKSREAAWCAVSLVCVSRWMCASACVCACVCASVCGHDVFPIHSPPTIDSRGAWASGTAVNFT